MMKRQRITAQTKEQGINSQDQISEKDISNVSVREFRIMIGKVFQIFENRIQKMQEGREKRKGRVERAFKKKEKRKIEKQR